MDSASPDGMLSKPVMKEAGLEEAGNEDEKHSCGLLLGKARVTSSPKIRK